MFAPIDGIDLDRYVELRRAIVTDGAGAPARLARVLDAAGLTVTAWARITAGWDERIRTHPVVRSEFQRRYLQPDPSASGR